MLNNLHAFALLGNNVGCRYIVDRLNFAKLVEVILRASITSKSDGHNPIEDIQCQILLQYLLVVGCNLQKVSNQ